MAESHKNQEMNFGNVERLYRRLVPTRQLEKPPILLEYRVPSRVLQLHAARDVCQHGGLPLGTYQTRSVVLIIQMCNCLISGRPECMGG